MELAGEAQIKNLNIAQMALTAEVKELKQKIASMEAVNQEQEAAVASSSTFLEEKVGNLHLSMSSKTTAAEAAINELSKKLTAPVVSLEAEARVEAMRQEDAMKQMVLEMRQVRACPRRALMSLTIACWKIPKACNNIRVC